MREGFEILVVEDEDVVLGAVQKVIGLGPFRLDKARTLEEGLAKLKEKSYQLAILDLLLPDGSSHSLLETHRADLPRIPFIFITGYATLENILTSFRLGAFDVVPKPFEPEELLGVIHRALMWVRKGRRSVLDSKRKEEPPPSPPPPGTCLSLGNHSRALIEEGGSAVFLAGPTFPGLIEDLEKVDYYPLDKEVIQGRPFVSFISRSFGENKVRAPLSGLLISRNEELTRNPSLLDTDPSGAGWLLKVAPTRVEEEIHYLTAWNQGGCRSPVEP